LRKETDRAYWFGVVLCVMAGLLTGMALGYKLGADTVIVVPLEQGIKT